MVRVSVLASLVAAAASPFAAAKFSGGAANSVVPGAYIFEFEDGHNKADVLRQANVKGTTRLNLDFKLFKGVSIQLDDVDNADEHAAQLASLPAVKKMWPVHVRSIPEPEIKAVGKVASGATQRLMRRENSTGDNFSPHVMTQVDKLHEKGITGKGIKIAVVDTGIDYTHPALGNDCFGPGCLVAFGTDLVGDDYTGFNTPHPDDDPMDCAGHGSHVAGIIAAQPNEFGFTGTAPGVTLGAYRVFGCDGSAGDDVLIAAYNKAFEDGADIITASIGGPSGWSEDPWAVAVSRIVDQGVPCTVSAGNEGATGQFYASTAANGNGVTAIASFDNVLSPAILFSSHYTVQGTSGKKEFGYSPGEPDDWAGVKLPLWTPDKDITIPNGGCDKYPADTPDLSKYIVLIRRGSCTFVQKAQNAADHGAKYIMFYNNVAGASGADVSAVTGIKSAAMVLAETGETWVKALNAGKKVTLQMLASDDPKSELSVIEPVNKATGGALSLFTSWGPTNEGQVKPQVGAPGGNILSTYPVAKGSYAVLSGTSMACPQTAGVVALIAQVRKTFDPQTIEDLLSANANPNLFNDGAQYYGFNAPVQQQGGGLIQAYDAAYAKTLLSPSSLAFNDSDHFNGKKQFSLKNTGSKEVTYKISHIPTNSFFTFGKGTPYADPFPGIEASGKQAKIAFSSEKVTLAAGHRSFVDVKLTPPTGLDKSRLPVYSGYIAVNGSDGSSLSLPYQGISGSLHDALVLGEEDAWISVSTDETSAPVAANKLFTIPGPGNADATSDLPAVTIGLAMGSPKVRAHIIPLQSAPKSMVVQWNGQKTLGAPMGFPASFLPRDINPYPWDGQLANGNYAPPGKYKVVIEALHIFGDESDKSDWDQAETPAFRIKYA